MSPALYRIHLEDSPLRVHAVTLLDRSRQSSNAVFYRFYLNPINQLEELVFSFRVRNASSKTDRMHLSIKVTSLLSIHTASAATYRS